MAESTKLPRYYADLQTLLKTIKSLGGIRTRPSKAALRRQLKDPDRRKRMQAYRWLRYRLNRRMR